MSKRVSDAINELADAAEAEGVPIDGEHGGAVHQWVLSRVDCKPSQIFFVVILLTAELADRDARREGYESQGDRAAKKAFDQFENAQTVYGLPPIWKRKANQ